MAYLKRDILFATLALLQLGANVAILAIVPIHLQDTTPKVCLLSNKISDNDPCNYAYIVAGIGGGASIIIALMIACHHALLTSFKALLLCVLSAWYAAGGGILTLHMEAANLRNLPQEYWRIVVSALVWANLGLTFLMSGINSFVKKEQKTQQLPH